MSLRPIRSAYSWALATASAGSCERLKWWNERSSKVPWYTPLTTALPSAPGPGTVARYVSRRVKKAWVSPIPMKSRGM